MKKRRKNKGRSLAAFVCSGLLSAGIILPYMSCRPFVRAVRAEEILQKTEKQLEAGDNVKGEAVVFAADSDSTTYAAKGDDLLDRAEEIFRVDSGIENPANASSASNAAGGPSEPKRIQGAIKLVKSSFMSTQELIEALYENPRVVYAEPNYLMDDSSDEKNEEGKEIPVQQERFEKNSAENDSSGPKALEDGQSGKKDDEPVKEEKKEETASEQADASEPEGEQENRQEDKPQQQEAEDQKLTPSNFGPSDYTPGQIPDMTQWQWGNWNNGSLAGTYTHSGQVDVQYEEWKTQTKEQMPEYVVAVLDSGIDETSPDLAEVLWTGDIFGSGGDSHGCFQRQWHSGSSTSMITNFHGTHIAGIIAGQWNGQGISGIASNVKLMSLRHDSTFATVLACMSYAKKAVKQGVNLIAVNNSWRMGSDTSNLINLAVTELGEMGVVSVFASGNDAANTDQIFDTPAVVANNPYTVVVNAVGPDGTKAGYSNYGLQPTDVMAPGS